MSMMPADQPQAQGARNARQAGSPSRRPNRRLQRIQDHLKESLANPDALAANVGAVGSDLMKLQYRLTKAVNTALARSTDLVEEFSSFLPAIHTCSQLSRQVYRLADLGYRLRAAPGNRLPRASAE